MIKKILIVFFVLISSFSYSFGNDGNDVQGVSLATESAGWDLVFTDDFNGTAVNQFNWGMYNGTGHAGNGLRKPEAFSVQNGILMVTAQMKDGKLVSGGMAHKINYTYGKFEFRVKTDADPSSATSGVVLTWPKSENWPIDGENDMYETGTASSRSSFHTFIHYGADNKQYHFEHKTKATEWNIVAMEWTKDSIRILRNGVMVYKLTDVNAIPDVAHHLCIQLDAFKPTMTGVVNMYVDWVKIYRPAVISGINLAEVSSTIRIFPNPVFNYINIESIDNQKIESFDIYSIDGRLVKSVGESIPRIDCGNLRTGLYYLKVNFKEKSKIVRFIKR